MYHFLSGYTAKVAGTEKGLTGVEPEFSTAFASPFLPRHPSVYGNMLRALVERHHVDCWLVNTGWTGGGYGVGRRMPIRVTRRLLAAALRRLALEGGFPPRPLFRLCRADLGARRRAAHPLPGENLAEQGRVRRHRQAALEMFAQNFERFEGHVDDDVRAARRKPRSRHDGGESPMRAL
jgi:phosphoenolpyruvate carboxykinase (ATP)